MKDERQTKAAEQLEELIPAIKEIVQLLRMGQAQSKAYALVYELRKRTGYVVRDLGTGLPTTDAQHYATDIIDAQTSYPTH